VKVKGVNLISNIAYNDASLTVWRAYGIGPGKCIRLSELTIYSTGVEVSRSREM